MHPSTGPLSDPAWRPPAMIRRHLPSAGATLGSLGCAPTALVMPPPRVRAAMARPTATTMPVIPVRVRFPPRVAREPPPPTRGNTDKRCHKTCTRSTRRGPACRSSSATPCALCRTAFRAPMLFPTTQRAPYSRRVDPCLTTACTPRSTGTAACAHDDDRPRDFPPPPSLVRMDNNSPQQQRHQ